MTAIMATTKTMTVVLIFADRQKRYVLCTLLDIERLIKAWLWPITLFFSVFEIDTLYIYKVCPGLHLMPAGHFRPWEQAHKAQHKPF